MKIQKVKGGVWVKAENELHQFVEADVVIKTLSDTIEVRFISWDSPKNYWEDVDEWLKPIEG